MPERQWIRVHDKRRRVAFNHAILVLQKGRIVTVCGRAFAFPHDVAIDCEEERRCNACQRRLVYTPYLIPQGRDLEKLLESPQLQLLEVRP
jgi:hypothetical protein